MMRCLIRLLQADRHVRSLDAEIAGYKTSLVLGTRPGTRPTVAVMPADDAAIFAAGDEAEGQINNATTPAKAQPKPKSKKARDQERRKQQAAEKARLKAEAETKEAKETIPTALEQTATAVTLPVLPVNAHEPIYCLCRSVSSGLVCSVSSVALYALVSP